MTTLLLGIDTCGPHGSVALARLPPQRTGALEAPGLSGDVLEMLAEAELAGKTYSARLVGAIRELLMGQNASVCDLGVIVVTSGPGSFTGIRVGLSTAKGLAEAHGTPLLAVSRLAVLAHVAGTKAAALDAGRGEFYLGEFGRGEFEDRSERLVARARFEEEAARLGEELAVCEAQALALALKATPVAPPTAAQALEFALPWLQARHFDDPVRLDGDYLRRSDAEIFARPRTGTTIRAMAAGDLAEVAAIAQTSPEAPRWKIEDYSAFAQNSSAVGGTSGAVRAGWVAVAGTGEILGFAAANLVLDQCELESMAVRADARRQGTGAALLRAVLAWAAEHGARHVGLEVRAGNAAAIGLYERQGLKAEGRRRGYYADPVEDAVLLGMPVPEVRPTAEFSTAQGS
jgi:tRNA threonylcarbamoyladenosine biosynthesis protein TsaB